MITKETAIDQIIQRNEMVRSLMDNISQIRQQANSICQQKQSEIDTLIGKNLMQMEIFELNETDLNEIIKKKAETQQPPATEPKT